MKKLFLALMMTVLSACEEVKLSSCELDLYITGTDSKYTSDSALMFARYAENYGWTVNKKSPLNYDVRDKERNSILVILDDTQSYHFDEEFVYATKLSTGELAQSQKMISYERTCNNSFYLSLPEIDKSIKNDFQSNHHVVFTKAENPSEEQILAQFASNLNCGWFKMNDFYHWASTRDFPTCIKK